MGYDIIGNTSGGGGGGFIDPTLNAHTVDGDTVAHWEFNGDATCGVVSPGQDFDVSSLLGWPLVFPGHTRRCLPDGSSTLPRSGVASGDVAALRFPAATAVTVAGCLFLSSDHQVDLVKLSTDTGGFSEQFVLSATVTTRTMTYGHSTSGSTYETATPSGTPPVFPINEWCWFAGVRNADGKSGTLRINGDSCTWTTSAVGRTTTSQRWSVFNTWDNMRPRASMYSLIIKDIACTTEQLDAMQAQTGIGL